MIGSELTMRFLIAFAAPAVVALVNIPLLLGRVPPNHWYGFRTQKTLSSPTVWYAANRFAGRLMTITAAVAILVNLLVMGLLPSWQNARLILVMASVLPALLVASALVALIYLRRL